MANPFDQFDATTSNAFDQFDAKQGAQTTATPAPVFHGRGYMDAAAIRNGSFNPAAAVGEGTLNIGSGLLSSINGGLAGLANSAFNNSPLGYAAHKLGVPEVDSADLIRKIQGVTTYQPHTASGQQFVNAAADPAFPTNWPGVAGNYLADKSADAGAPALVSTSLRMAPEIAAALVGGRRVEATAKPAEVAPAADVVPTRAELKAASSAAYKRSEDIGAVVSENKFANFQKDLTDNLKKQGIDPDLHPDATAALKRVSAESGPMSLEKLETLRRIAQDAEGSIKPADKRMAGEIVDALDDMVDQLKPEDLAAGTPEAAASLKEARNYWSRQRKAADLDELMRRAELSAPNFSASGMENAIRTEFRGLAKNQRRLSRFTPEEQAAITRVARGGPLENGLRLLGKLAPTGVISGGAGIGIGALIGGPIGAAVVPAIGGLSRLGARGLTGRNASLANELVRRGPVGSPQPGIPSAVTPAIAAAPSSISAAPIAAVPRSPLEIQADMQRVGRIAQSLPASVPRTSPQVQSIWREFLRLQEELAKAESRGAAQGAPGARPGQ